MNLDIGKYRITSDPMNVILNIKFQKRDKEGNPSGEVGYKPVGYFKDLESACNRILNMEILTGQANNFEELKALIIQTKQTITAAIREGSHANE
ncbi:hypothetical protein [Bacillus nakamurai]|uniref:hypothetical protein n=1 Tax=Bacillus nakamurai TaxID=1793963 RepID=UPI0020C5950C|nr:hypothetical protein [Bacillus nakamurai]MCP6683210.1 hypothetical protein [Bacillus nakamurai]